MFAGSYVFSAGSYVPKQVSTLIALRTVLFGSVGWTGCLCFTNSKPIIAIHNWFITKHIFSPYSV